MPVASPLAGGIFADVKHDIVVTDAPAAPKEGKACATTILGWNASYHFPFALSLPKGST
jgi:hypothetical protein